MGKVCCFIGHRKIENKEIIKKILYNVIEDLIANQNVSTFLFGSRGKFYSLCLDVFAKIREKYEHIKNIACKCRHECCLLVDDENETDKNMYLMRKKILSLNGLRVGQVM